MTHGWPGSVIEFSKVIDPLVDPVAHRADASDALELVIPSLPGHGWSGKPTATGWTFEKIAHQPRLPQGRRAVEDHPRAHHAVDRRRGMADRTPVTQPSKR
jgi:pimeloyl-ACP methyl ester carboxylesterase